MNRYENLIDIANRLDEEALLKQNEAYNLAREIEQLHKAAQEHRKEAEIIKKNEDIFNIQNGDRVYYTSVLGETISLIFSDQVTNNKILLARQLLCKSKEYTELRAKKQELSNKLEQFSWQNGGKSIDWKDKDQVRYYISQESNVNCVIAWYGYEINGIVYFASREVAEQVSNKYKPLFEEIRILEEKLRGE